MSRFQFLEEQIKTRPEIWCDRDEHSRFENYLDFNDWLDSEDGITLREKYRIAGLAQPSKAFFAGDKEGYNEAFIAYHDQRINEVLNQDYLIGQFGDDHWFKRNLTRFEQLIDYVERKSVVPFIGAGVSASGGFPSWQKHLYEQGRTAGLNASHVKSLLNRGEYEAVIEEIENSVGREVFINEIRDVFSKTGTMNSLVLRISELFNDTLITTNYDKLMERAYDTGGARSVQIISGANAEELADPTKVTIYKLHGDIRTPVECILSKNQYDHAYGLDELDLSLPIPKILSYFYTTSNLLFIGCSLNNDRTVQVFRAIKEQVGEGYIPTHFAIEQAPETERELVERNAFLARIGISGIWYEKGCFDYVDGILRLARNELRYRGE